MPDGAPSVSREQMFERIQQITEASGVPVNGDLEDGYGAQPEAVADTIRLAREAGLAGGNIEDYDGHNLYDEALSVERIAAAREAAGPDFVLTARTDGQLLASPTSLADSIHRANLYREAGADCLYVPGVNDLDAISTLVKEIDGPLNVVIGLGSATLTTQALLAGRRYSHQPRRQHRPCRPRLHPPQRRGTARPRHDQLRRRPDPAGRAQRTLRRDQALPNDEQRERPGSLIRASSVQSVLLGSRR